VLDWLTGVARDGSFGGVVLITRSINAGFAALWGPALWFLGPFISIAMYSSPSTDDFCLASHKARELLPVVLHYYLNGTGRLSALVMITIPSVITRTTGLDLYAVYPLINVCAIIALVIAMIAAAANKLGDQD
jgi:hypothetical protein